MNIKGDELKILRDATGAGIMSCKKALEESRGDIEKAIEILRKQGLAKAVKKIDREAKEGIIYSYIHPGDRIGVLLELNCETDFVAKTSEFRTLAKELALQIAATAPIAISRESIPQELIEKERTIYEDQAKESGKPDNIAKKIAQGRLEKWMEEVSLLD
ncbi:MAG: translation elongation factor Ts, partial [bacterium]